jgi:hypothetical protein
MPDSWFGFMIAESGWCHRDHRDSVDPKPTLRPMSSTGRRCSCVEPLSAAPSQPPSLTADSGPEGTGSYHADRVPDLVRVGVMAR